MESRSASSALISSCGADISTTNDALGYLDNKDLYSFLNVGNTSRTQLKVKQMNQEQPKLELTFLNGNKS